MYWKRLVWGTVVASSLGVAIQPAEAAEVYKMQISSDGRTGLTLPLPLPITIDASRQEWVVVTVDGPQVTIRHTTSVANFIGRRAWYDHPATSIRMCVVQGFELFSCQETQGDTAMLPQGTTIHDVKVDFKYIESGLIHTQSFQIAPDFKPER